MTKGELDDLKVGDVLQYDNTVMKWVVVKELEGKAFVASHTLVVRWSERELWRLYHRGKFSGKPIYGVRLTKRGFQRLKMGDVLKDNVFDLSWVIVMKTEDGDYITTKTMLVKETELSEWSLLSKRRWVDD
ncbi:MAG: hypothetical protein AAB575_03970 [Patescibacteria group bacterium]